MSNIIPSNPGYAAQVLEAKSAFSRSGRNISIEEMQAIVASLKFDVQGITEADKTQLKKDLGPSFKAGNMDRGARKLYLDTLKPSKLIDPPIVALYAVAINDAVARGEVEEMVALSSAAHRSLTKDQAGPRLAAQSLTTTDLGQDGGAHKDVEKALARLDTAIVHLAPRLAAQVNS